MAERVESRFDTISRKGKAGMKRIDAMHDRVVDIACYMDEYFGTVTTTTGVLLPAFAVVRKFMERTQSGEPVEVTDFNRALEEGNHMKGDSDTWETQRDILVKAYLIDRKAIDAALDESKRQ